MYPSICNLFLAIDNTLCINKRKEQKCKTKFEMINFKEDVNKTIPHNFSMGI